MKYKSALVTEASGSVGGLTASHNRGGLYLRSRTTPVNGNTPEQQAVRNAMTSAAAAWNSTIDAAQREAWNGYAAGVSIVDALGDARQPSGINVFSAMNAQRLRLGLALVEDPPATWDTPVISSLVATVDASADTISLAFAITDPWADSDLGGAGLAVYTSAPYSLGRTFFKGPYRLAGFHAAIAVPVTPALLSLPVPVATGQQIAWYARGLMGDGRYSGRFQGVNIVVA
jgi:hypothetical protein